MRERLQDEKSQERARLSAINPRSLTARIERFMAAICQSVELDSAWEQPMRLLLTHPRPTPSLRELHSAMRAVIRRAKFDEHTVDVLLAAVKAAERKVDMVEFFEPIQLALLAFVVGLSSQPKTLMPVAWTLIRIGGIEVPVAPSFATRSTKAAPPGTTKTALAIEPVTLAVVRSVAAVLEECSRGDGAFDSWSEDELKGGLDALWLAYSYCEVGTVGRHALKRDQLQKDLAQFGAPLWRKLASCLDSPTIRDGNVRKPAAIADLARLTLYVANKVSEAPSPPSRYPPSEACPSRNQLIVCRRSIPDSSDKQDKEEIARHRVLEEALPVVAMPSVQALEEAGAKLRSEFPWASTSLNVIFDDLVGRANIGVASLLIPPTLLVGPPGAGKSRLARRLAETFEIPRLDVSLAGTSDSKLLGGTSRGWATGRPNDLASLLARHRCASALVILDEIDKAADSHRDAGGINSYLLGLLEPETAGRHYDSFLKTECDFSQVSWICTANTISKLSAPLRSRLRVLSVPQPSREHFPAIANNVIIELEQRWGLAGGVLPRLDELGVKLERLTSVRQLRSAVEASVTSWSRDVVKH